MQAVVVEVGVESGGAGGVQRPAVPRPALVDVVLGHEQVDVGRVLRSHIYGAVGFVVSQLDRAAGRDGKEGVVEEKAGKSRIRRRRFQCEI